MQYETKSHWKDVYIGKTWVVCTSVSNDWCEDSLLNVLHVIVLIKNCHGDGKWVDKYES